MTALHPVFPIAFRLPAHMGQARVNYISIHGSLMVRMNVVGRRTNFFVLWHSQLWPQLSNWLLLWPLIQNTIAPVPWFSFSVADFSPSLTWYFRCTFHNGATHKISYTGANQPEALCIAGFCSVKGSLAHTMYPLCLYVYASYSCCVSPPTMYL